MSDALKDKACMALAHLAGTIDAVLFFASLGFWNTSLRAKVLFHEWFQ
mgnify:FL=1